MKSVTLGLLTLIPTGLFAQDPCAGITITSVRYHPFTDTAIVVNLVNNGPGLFNYPGFVLINDNGDTLAVETVNFFGLGQESMHILPVNPGIADPLDIFSGDLELHTNFYDTLACTWPINESLCVSGSCSNMVIGLQNWGGALVVGDFAWSVTDTSGNSLDSGTMTMVDTVQHWTHTICAPPGMYIYNMEALTAPSGGGPHITVSDSEGFFGPQINAPLDWFNQTGTSLEVPFYLHCASSEPNSSPVLSRNVFDVRYQGEQIILSNISAFNSIELMTVNGEIVSTLTSNSTSTIIPNNLSSGTYIVVGTYSDGSKVSKKVIKP